MYKARVQEPTESLVHNLSGERTGWLIKSHFSQLSYFSIIPFLLLRQAEKAPKLKIAF